MMHFIKKIKIIAFLVLSFLPAYMLHAEKGVSDNKNPISWQEALKNLNKKVAYEEEGGVLGVSVGKQIARITVHAQETEKLSDYYFQLPETYANRCKTNYGIVKTYLQENPLFKDYGLTAIDPESFCELTIDDLSIIGSFAEDEYRVSQASQYKKVILLMLHSENSLFWFVINPQDKMITFNYDDALNLNKLEVLNTASKTLSVK